METSGAMAVKRMQFQIPGDEGMQKKKKRKPALLRVEIDEARCEPWFLMCDTDMTAQWKRVADEQAEFRNVQKQAIESIAAGESPVVAVIPTGAGECTLFMLLA